MIFLKSDHPGIITFYIKKKKNLFLFGKEENHLDFFISMDFGNNDQVYYASAFDWSNW